MGLEHNFCPWQKQFRMTTDNALRASRDFLLISHSQSVSSVYLWCRPPACIVLLYRSTQCYRLVDINNPYVYEPPFPNPLCKTYSLIYLHYTVYLGDKPEACKESTGTWNTNQMQGMLRITLHYCSNIQGGSRTTSFVCFCNHCNIRFDPIPPKTWTKGHRPLDDLWPQVC